MTQQEAEVILKVNDQNARGKLEKLQAQAADLRQKFAEAFRKGDTRGIDSINKELQKVDKQINNLRINAANIRAAMERLDQASPRELLRTIKLINNELNSGRVKRGTKEWDDYVEKLKQVQAELSKVKKEMQPDNSKSFLEKVKDGINVWGASAAAAAAAFAGVVMSGKAAVQAYADMEAEEANVRKFTGMTAEEVASLNEEFKKLDTRTSREELNKLAQEAGRLGKTKPEDVLGFVKAADQINVALDDLGEGATLTLSKLTGIFGDEARFGTEQSLLKVGSVINELSQNCSASAPYLAEFSSRIGGIAAQSKMTISQVMAFAAVLDSNNLAVEASSTAVGQLITSIYQEPAKIAKAAGMDVSKFSKMVKEDMNGALIALFEQLNRFGGMESLASVFDSMGTDGARAIPVLTALASHVDTLKWQQSQANQAFKEGISVTNEFNVQNNTVQAQLDKAKKGFNEMAVALGEQLLPVMRYCISGSSMMMRVISEIVNFVISYRKELLVLVGILASYYAGVVLSKAATIAHTVAVAADTAVTKTAAAIQTAYNAVVGMGRVVVLAFTQGLGAAKAAFVALNSTMKANALGLVLSLVAAVTTAFIAAARKVTEFSRKMAEARNTANKIREEAIVKVGEEKSKIDLLVAAARNELLSLEERQKAINQLNEIIPNYNGQLDATTGKYKENKKALDNYLNSLARQYELEGAEAQLKEIGKEKAAAAVRLNKAQTAYDNAKSEMSNANYLNGQYSTSWGMVGNSYFDATDNLKKTLDAANNDMDVIKAKEKSIFDAYGVDLEKKAANNTPISTPTVTPSGGTPTPAKPDKHVQDAHQAESEAQRKAREALKNDLDERKSLYLQTEAENLTLYVTGQQSYADYLAKKKEQDQKYTDDVIKIHEDHNKLDIAEYGQALKSKADLLKKQQDEERKRSLTEVESEHKTNTDEITSAFFDPSSADFQNKVLLNQKLLDEDLRYLQEKRDLYAEGSEEWAALDREYNERIKQDQLEKQKETAQALMEFEKQYRSASGSTRMQNELRLLDQLHEKKLISEKEFQKAKRDIEKKYEEEDKERLQERSSEYGDMVTNLYKTIVKFFEDLGEEGGDWIGNLADLAQAAYTLMSAALSQYTAYANAERDIELAKIEKRYDKEIKAAGKNSKKKKKLEEQKEAEIAKVKKKYNDRAMKIEIAQAVAQTAVAAISAYASASKEAWWLGPVAAALALAAGAVQIATIKKQHEAQAAGYYEGGFTSRDPNNRREVGVVHANEFVANHQAVANPALSPVLRLIDTAQRNNTVGSLTAADVSNALGQGSGVSARGVAATAGTDSVLRNGLAVMADNSIANNETMARLADALDEGIEAKVILDGEDGFHKKYKHFLKLQNNPKR